MNYPSSFFSVQSEREAVFSDVRTGCTGTGFLQFPHPSMFTDREKEGKTDRYVGAWNEQQKLQNGPQFFADPWSFFSCGERKRTELFFKI